MNGSAELNGKLDNDPLVAVFGKLQDTITTTHSQFSQGPSRLGDILGDFIPRECLILPVAFEVDCRTTTVYLDLMLKMRRDG